MTLREDNIEKYNPKHKKCKFCGEILLDKRQTYCGIPCQKEQKKIRDKAKQKSVKWHKARGVTKKKLDTLWSKKVRERDGKCLYCEGTKNLNAHHIYSRKNHSTRWDMSNGCTLCVSHHKFDRKFAAHDTPIEFSKWLISYYGEDFLDQLKLKANGRNDKTHQEWWDILNTEER